MQAQLSFATVQTLDDLRSFEWFNKVGIHDTSECIVLESWDEAMKSCADSNWEDLCFDASNQYRTQIGERDLNRLCDWNDVVKLVKPFAISVFNEKCAKVMSEFELPKIFRDTVEWDILHLLLEAEYSDICPPGFYAQNAYCYAQGHFPCGWKGSFPNGKLIIF